MRLLERNIPLGPRTSFRIGGPARYYAAVRNAEDVLRCVRWARNHEQPLLVLGKGSNILISDEGWPGLVVDFAARFNAVTWKGDTVTAQGGALLHTLVRESVDHKLGGIERLAGIPGSIGGAAIMNAGAFGQTIDSCILFVDTVRHDGSGIERLDQKTILFGYRDSSLKQDGAIVVSVGLQLRRDRNRSRRFIYADVLRRRRAKQPLDLPNCGSVFKRPPGSFAGTLIERCGLKELRIGDAMVSPKHANFIVNVGGATASDVRRLVAEVQRRVHEATGVVLEPELIFIGSFSTPLL